MEGEATVEKLSCFKITGRKRRKKGREEEERTMIPIFARYDCLNKTDVTFKNSLKDGLIG